MIRWVMKMGAHRAGWERRGLPVGVDRHAACSAQSAQGGQLGRLGRLGHERAAGLDAGRCRVVLITRRPQREAGTLCK